MYRCNHPTAGACLSHEEYVRTNAFHPTCHRYGTNVMWYMDVCNHCSWTINSIIGKMYQASALDIPVLFGQPWGWHLLLPSLAWVARTIRWTGNFACAMLKRQLSLHVEADVPFNEALQELLMPAFLFTCSVDLASLFWGSSWNGHQHNTICQH